MKPRYRNKTDQNHAEIVRYLRSHGVEVIDHSGAGGIPDLQTYYRERARWIEVKVPGRERRYTRTQLQFIAGTKMDVTFATNEQDALTFATEGTGRLTPRQKDAIAGMLLRDGKASFTPAMVERVLESK